MYKYQEKLARARKGRVKIMKMFLIDVENGSAGSVDIEPSLEKYYELLKCDCIDIAERQIGGVYYDFIVDDEGLFKEKPIASVFDTSKKPMLVGNVLICLHDGEGNEVGLEDKDIKLIEGSLLYCKNGFTGKVTRVIVGADY